MTTNPIDKNIPEVISDIIIIYIINYNIIIYLLLLLKKNIYLYILFFLIIFILKNLNKKNLDFFHNYSKNNYKIKIYLFYKL